MAGPTPPTSRSSGRPAPWAPTTSSSRCPTATSPSVTEAGRSLSAGQRQLLCLARAQLVDPTLLILDEATSNLDLATEAKVQRAMNLAAKGRTTLVIAHRLQTARHALANRRGRQRSGRRGRQPRRPRRRRRPLRRALGRVRSRHGAQRLTSRPRSRVRPSMRTNAGRPPSRRVGASTGRHRSLLDRRADVA